MRNVANIGGPILVTGDTGQQGGAVADQLLAQGYRVRALTRDPSKPNARGLERRGAEVVKGDLSDRASIEKVLAGCYGCFSVQNFWESGVATEIRQGKLLAELAKAAGVKHFVYSSVGSANRQTGLPHFDSKWEIEEHIRDLRLDYTIFRPVFFMQNWKTYAGQYIDQGVLPQPMPPDRGLQQIAVEDIGAFVAMAFSDPETWIGRAVDIAGDELKLPEVAEKLSKALGHPVVYQQIPLQDFAKVAGDEMAKMYRWFDEVGYDIDIPALRAIYPALMTFDDYLATHKWTTGVAV